MVRLAKYIKSIEHTKKIHSLNTTYSMAKSHGNDDAFRSLYAVIKQGKNTKQILLL